MSNLKLKQLLKKQGILVPFLIVCSLFISEKTSAVYDKECCYVYGSDENVEGYIHIIFKFFEYDPKHGLKNSYLKKFEVTYLKGSDANFIHLMSASSDYQLSKTWAWIRLTDKKANEKIEIAFPSRNHPGRHTKMIWKEDCSLKLDVANHVYCSEVINTNNCILFWYPTNEVLSKVTKILIKAKWYNYENMRTEDVLLLYDVTPKNVKLNSKSSNCSNSFPIQEIQIDAKDNTVKAYKEANAIVIEGALNENIQVYTTTGALVKSVVAECDVLQIPVPANQLYIVKVGQGRYKVAL